MHKGGDSIQSAGRDTEIVFVYEPTPADYEAALRRYVYGTWPGRRGVLIPAALITVLVLAFAEVRGFSPAVVALLVVVAVVTAVVTTVRTLTRVAREQVGDMEEYGTCRTVVGEEGLTTTGGDQASTIDWQAFPWYVETDELFALTTVKTRIFFVVPKRGAQDPADVDALRAVLDRNLRRL
ncbi:YcxB family protein [Streptomyces fulvoviolaceus]|uniref:YcxB family protein n=1 Tax=Streptomyces fulvoviolaceus TaxID=285535 RepID=UPI0021BE4893|nr:YcxB family protein [Streptomyces fulvoviolaceus]MCT9078588.1 YcxB family protein [Streptomyces fulvoviolaceus]